MPVMKYRLSVAQMLALLELGTRNHLLALNALGIPWVGKGRK